MVEIEKKFTVNKALWEKIKKPAPNVIKQSYISDDKKCTVRVRIKNNTCTIFSPGKSYALVFFKIYSWKNFHYKSL